MITFLCILGASCRLVTHLPHSGPVVVEGLLCNGIRAPPVVVTAAGTAQKGCGDGEGLVWYMDQGLLMAGIDKAKHKPLSFSGSLRVTALDGTLLTTVQVINISEFFVPKLASNFPARAPLNLSPHFTERPDWTNMWQLANGVHLTAGGMYPAPAVRWHIHGVVTPEDILGETTVTPTNGTFLVKAHMPASTLHWGDTVCCTLSLAGEKQTRCVPWTPNSGWSRFLVSLHLADQADLLAVASAQMVVIFALAVAHLRYLPAAANGLIRRLQR